jgi:hypothetical protein|tara:strand:- start:22 stop:774 length:753 start_codon:yes stop_codon:yes gene_type:complete
MDYDSLTVLQLKNLCKDRGIRISGNKAEVVIRLMEDDESKAAPAQQIVNNPQVEMMQQQMAEMKTIIIRNENRTNAVATIVGAFLSLYAISRMFITLQFLPFFAEEGTGFSIILAFVICFGLIYSAILIMRNYRIGSYIAFGVLTISGGLSLLLHDADFNPLSLGFGGWVPMSWSAFCSGSCILIALLPLIDQSMKSELPPELEGAFGSNAVAETSTNRVICTNCRSDLEVPKSYTGRIECPSCTSQMNV